MRANASILGLVLIVATLASTPIRVSAADSKGGDFDRRVRPVVEKYCLDCHGEKKPKGGINLAKFRDQKSIESDPETWLQVVDALSERTMPPEGKPEPTEDERQAACSDVQAILDAIENVNDPGPSLIQRLTREQYNNTIRDLLGVDDRPADRFPPDGGGGEGFDNNASTLFLPPILLEKYLDAAVEILDKADPGRYLIARPAATSTDAERQAAARRCVAAFAYKAFRRPVADSEIDRYIKLYEKFTAAGSTYDEAVKKTLRGVLVSPHFVYLVERRRESSEPYPVSQFELACRLSYFLWSSMPDQELFDLAAAGRLNDDSELEKQVERMLADSKSKALAKNFVGQWLRVAGLANAVEPDRGLFPGYSAELRDAMIEEPIVFFHELLRENHSLIQMLDSDYTYVNEILAKHYAIDHVSGPSFRRVKLTDADRGGVLGMASVLAFTSYPRRTSPVLRGKWVLEELLGTPPPPPPPMVKTLPEDDRPRKGRTFRQSLEDHRKDENCASCHAKMDPIGFGLESFDPIGRKRTKIADQPIDDAGELPGGLKFKGPGELKKILLDEKRTDLFLQNVTRRLLSYAIRRGVEYYDMRTIKSITTKLKENGYGGRTLVAEIVKCYPFRYRSDASPTGNRGKR